MRTVYPILVLTAVVLSCRKSTDVIPGQRPDSPEIIRQSCDFGQRQFNTIRRANVQEEFMIPEGIQSGPPDAVLLLDFDGHVVSNTSWNFNGNIVCGPANLAPAEIAEVINRVSEDFAAFNIAVTTNENLYNQCNANRRMRVIVTETWEWFGQAGGVAFLNSFTWGNNTPCFVFSVLLNYVPKKIAEAVSHETGHTLGLYHQSLYDPGCLLLTEYYAGQGSGQLSWAPVMGVGYTRNMTTWRRGSSINGCNNIQDDIGIISATLQFRTDDHQSQFNRATRVTGTAETGCISNSADVDLFQIDRDLPCSVTVTPFHVNSNNEGANLDIKLKIYNRDRVLLATIDDPYSLAATASLGAGRFYVSVETTENANASRYGQLGNYSLSIN